MLTQFIRDENNNPIGCIVAIQHEDGFVSYGVSLCSPKDHWDRDLGRKIAIGRAYANGVMPSVPHGKEGLVAESVANMVDRARRYFKGAAGIVGGGHYYLV
jgi:hypothetical protein